MDGEKYMRVQFYVDGSKRKGTVQIDLKKVGLLAPKPFDSQLTNTSTLSYVSHPVVIFFRSCHVILMLV